MADRSRISVVTAILALLVMASCTTTDPLTLTAEQSYNLGNAYMELGRTEDAEQAFRSALQEYPGYHAAAYNLALLYTSNRKYSQALEVLEAYIAEEQESRDWRMLEAYVYYRNGDSNQALSDYARILEEWPGADLELEVAKVALNLGQYDTAQDYLLDLFNSGNMSGELLYLLGEFDTLTGGGDGREWYQTAVLEDPGYLPALEKFLEYYKDAEPGSDIQFEVYGILQEAQAAHPGEVRLLLELGRLALTMEGEDGISYYRMALEAGYADVDNLLSIYDSLEGETASAFLGLLEDHNLIRVVTVTKAAEGPITE